MRFRFQLREGYSPREGGAGRQMMALSLALT